MAPPAGQILLLGAFVGALALGKAFTMTLAPRTPKKFQPPPRPTDWAAVLRGVSSNVSKSAKLVGTGLGLLGNGVVTAKDAVYDGIDAAFAAPDTIARRAEEAAKEAEAARQRALYLVGAPQRTAAGMAAAGAAVMDGLTTAKDSVYGTVEAVVNLPGTVTAPFIEFNAAIERQRREAREAEVRRAEALAAAAAALEGAKGAVYATADVISTAVDIAIAAPATVTEIAVGVAAAAEEAADVAAGAVAAAQRLPEEVKVRIDSTVHAAEDTVASVRGAAQSAQQSVQNVRKFSKDVVAVVSGQRRREEEERKRQAAAAKAAAAAKREAALMPVKAAWTGVKFTGAVLKAVADGTVAAVGLAQQAAKAPEAITRATLGPLYEYRQSQARIREAIRLESEAAAAAAAVAAAAPEPVAAMASSAETGREAAAEMEGNEAGADGAAGAEPASAEVIVDGVEEEDLVL